MYNIYHDFPIHCPSQQAFEAVSSAKGLDAWWSNEAHGIPELGAEYVLQFGPMYVWRAVVTRCKPGAEFELTMTDSDADWHGTQVGFTLEETGSTTLVKFHHLGWPELNGHFRGSSFCWAMYLNCLRGYVERGEIVPYSKRLNG